MLVLLVLLGSLVLCLGRLVRIEVVLLGLVPLVLRTLVKVLWAEVLVLQSRRSHWDLAELILLVL